MEEKYKKFLEIDWANNKDWQEYYSNIYPTPPGNQINRIKKRFYKFKIDYDFDLNYEPEQTQSNQSNRQTTSNTQPTFHLYYSQTKLGKVVSLIEMLFWVTSIFLFISYFKYCLHFSIFVLAFRVIKRTGRPRLTMDYAQSLFLDEHLHIFILHILYLIDRQNQYLILPYYLTAVLNISDCMRNYGVFLGFSNKIVNKRVTICELRANCDIMIGFLLVFGVFLKTNSFLLPIFYWQYLRFKYIFNSDTNLAFARFNYYANKVKNKLPRPVGFVIGKIQELVSYLGRTESKNGEKAGGANCSIF